MDGHTALLARARHGQEPLLAEHEDRVVLEEVHRHHRRASNQAPRAVDNGGDIGEGVGHAAA